MGQGSKNCKLPSHQLLKDKAKNRVEDLQFMLNSLQLARKESRARDVATLEEQVNQILRDWKAELDEPTPASSLLEDSLGSFSAELGRLLRQYEEEDDAMSPLTAVKHGHATDTFAVADSAGDKLVYDVNHTSQPHEFQGFENHMMQQHEFQGFEQYNNAAPSLQGTIISNFEDSGLHNLVDGNLEISTQLDYHQLDGHQNFDSEIFVDPSGIEQWGVDGISNFSDLFLNISPPPSAFFGT